MVASTVQQIADQNDRFRQGDPNIPGTRFITAGIDHLLKRSETPVAEIALLVTQFDDFTDGNDPHKEREFGAFQFNSNKCFWKIDYYDLDYSMGSDDPSDLSKTCRLITIMLADEW
ncbi:MAG: DUF3768 domain-containing protein [Lentilitoribacter sp.]